MYFLKIRYIIFFCFVFLIYQSSIAQEQQFRNGSNLEYNIRHYTDENGLPQNSVKSIVQDSWGNIWIASEQGLVRFDGRTFVTFDDFGKLSRSMYPFHISLTDVDKEFYASNSDDSIIRIYNGTAVMDTTFRKRLFRQPFMSRTKSGTRMTMGLPYNYGELVPPDNYVIPMGWDKYLVCDATKVEYYENKNKIKAFPFKAKRYWDFFRLGNDLYHIDQNQKLTRFQSKGSSSQPEKAELTGDIENNSMSISKGRYQLFWNNCSNQTFISLGKSLYLLSQDKNGGITSELIMEGFDFKASNIATIYFDKKTGKLFLGSQINGLYVIEKKPFQAHTTSAAGTDNNYYAQTILRDGAVLANQGIAFSWNTEQKKMAVSHLPLISKSVTIDKSSILTDRQGFVWCKRYQDLFKFDPAGKRLLSKWKVPSYITQLHEGKNGLIWIGTRDTGLYYINPDKHQPRPKRFLRERFPDISWIKQQNDDILWVATYEGLYKVLLKSKKVSSIKGLQSVYIRSLYIPEKQNEIWITTYKDGIFLLKHGKLIHFPLDRNKYLANAHCIVEDRKGFFWITTNKGLFQISKKDLLSYARKPFDIYYYYYSRADGFNINEFNGGCQPCAVKTRSEYVSLPSMNGLVWFIPEQTRPQLPKYGINVEEVNIDSVRQDLSKKSVSVSNSSAELLVKINVPYFGDMNNLKISYRILKGEEPIMEWKPVNNQNMTIAIPPLDPGDYTLSIRKINGFGRDNYSYQSLNIKMERQWYETWWFRLFLFVAVLALFHMVLKQRLKAIKKQNLILEAKVKERTRHLEQTLKILNTSEKELEQQVRLHTRMIASITHDVRNPIRHTTAALRHVHELIDKKEWETAKYVTEKIGDNTDRIYQLIDDMISFIKPQAHRANADFEPTNLYTLVKERADIFKDISSGMIDINIPADEVVNTNPKLLGVVIHNLIDNAIKAKPGNRIRLYTVRNKQQLHLLCTDQGPGIPAKLQNWLNTAEADENTSLPANYEGLGLLMVKEITKILKVAVHVENNPGARIRLSFDL